MEKKVRHILSLSGGKDSAALAVYMRDRVAEMEYVFHDTDKELPETYAYRRSSRPSWARRFSGLIRVRFATRAAGPADPRSRKRRTGGPRASIKPNPYQCNMGFDQWLKVFGGMIPSPHRRWCTKMLKLVPFEQWVGDDPVINYIGIRADEERGGYISHKPNITPVYPFRDDGLVYADIVRILEESGLGLPRYTDWGRTRSGCFFCFYQQKIEWVRLKETYPGYFEQAKQYEYANKLNGNPFYWNGSESLEELERPERMEEIKRKWEESRSQPRKGSKKTLLHILGDLEDPDEPREGCLICQL